MFAYKSHRSTQNAFTIVELLIVIVVIAILAAITLVVFSGIRDRAENTRLQAEVSGYAKILKADQALIDGKFPATLDVANQGKGLTGDSGTTLQYTVDNSADSPTFCLSAVKGKYTAHIGQAGSVSDGVCAGHTGVVVAFEGVAVGSQSWAPTNVNIGSMVDRTTEQTNNSIVEKWCYDGLEANCSTYGALYSWNEAMQYSTTEGAQGVCPAGSHIPTDGEWKILEVELGMKYSEEHNESFRGSDQGAQLKSGGSSGLSLPLAGARFTGGSSYVALGTAGKLWTSTLSGTSAWTRYIQSNTDRVGRDTMGTAYNYGYSVRCVGG